MSGVIQEEDQRMNRSRTAAMVVVAGMIAAWKGFQE
jgi:hypothetical protein